MRYVIRRFLATLSGAFLCFSNPANSRAETTETAIFPGPFEVKIIAPNVRVPWAMAFAPDGRLFFTERPGQVRVIENQKLRERPVFTVPDILANVKLGLMGLVLHPRFGENHLVYLAYSYGGSQGERVRVMRYRETSTTLVESFVVIEDIPAATNHAGCRIRFGPDGKLFITTGDANKPELAQQLDSLGGKILRLNDDGSVPNDNPFVSRQGVRPEIWSYGHRNSQGLDWQAGSNVLFASEHGPDGGDEINIIEPGKNYGWPVIHHRVASRPGMEDPLLEFTPSIAPASGMFYRGSAWPALRGNFLVGCLRGEGILAVHLQDKTVISKKWILKSRYGRLREVLEAPDGSLYVSTSMYDPPESASGGPGYDMILHIVPGHNSTP